jgi:hypothetical protein
MSKEEFNKIVDEAYEQYSIAYEKDNSVGLTLLVVRLDGQSTYRKPDKQMFIDLCTFDTHFSDTWGLKIEERILRQEERIGIINSKDIFVSKSYIGEDGKLTNEGQLKLDKLLPTKQIILTYNGKTIIYYE